MRVLVNGLLLTEKYSGVEYSLHHLLSAMAKKTAGCSINVLVSKNYQGPLQSNALFNIERLKIDASSKWRRVAYEHSCLARHFNSSKSDLYHATTYVLPFLSKLPAVVTIHDLIALDFPELCHPRNAFYYNLAIPLSVKNAKRIIAVSETVKQRLVVRLGVPEEKIDVIHHGVDSLFRPIHCMGSLTAVRKKYNLPENYILFVGNLEPKKNLPRLIMAFTELKRHTAIKHKLVIVGKKAWKYAAIFKEHNQSLYGGDILFTDYVHQEDLPAIYTMASLFVFPSLYEGFGLPLLEAMACGTPVLISTAGALPEIAGNGFPMANPQSVDDLAGKMAFLIGDKELRQKMSWYGLKNSKRFSWDKAAAKTILCYQKALQD